MTLRSVCTYTPDLARYNLCTGDTRTEGVFLAHSIYATKVANLVTKTSSPEGFLKITVRYPLHASTVQNRYMIQ